MGRGLFFSNFSLFFLRGQFSLCRTLIIPGNAGKFAQKSKEIDPTKKARKSKKARIGGSGARFGPIRSVSGGFWRVYDSWGVGWGQGGSRRRGLCKGKEHHSANPSGSGAQKRGTKTLSYGQDTSDHDKGTGNLQFQGAVSTGFV